MVNGYRSITFKELVSEEHDTYKLHDVEVGMRTDGSVIVRFKGVDLEDHQIELLRKTIEHVKSYFTIEDARKQVKNE